MPTELEIKKIRLEKIQDGCEADFAQLQEATQGRFGMDTMSAYVAMLVDTLVELGVITEENKLDMEISFYTQVQEKLSEAWAQYRQQKAEHDAQQKGGKLAVVKNPTVLLDAHGRPMKK